MDIFYGFQRIFFWIWMDIFVGYEKDTYWIWKDNPYISIDFLPLSTDLFFVFWFLFQSHPFIFIDIPWYSMISLKISNNIFFHIHLLIHWYPWIYPIQILSYSSLYPLISINISYSKSFHIYKKNLGSQASLLTDQTV